MIVYGNSGLFRKAGAEKTKCSKRWSSFPYLFVAPLYLTKRYSIDWARRAPVLWNVTTVVKKLYVAKLNLHATQIYIELGHLCVMPGRTILIPWNGVWRKNGPEVNCPCFHKLFHNIIHSTKNRYTSAIFPSLDPVLDPGLAPCWSLLYLIWALHHWIDRLPSSSLVLSSSYC